MQVHELARKSKEVQDAKPSVEFMKPRRIDQPIHLVLPGNALPLQQTSIFPRANGYLKALYVDIGDHVTAGQLLAVIDTPEVDAQLASAKASVEQSLANLTKSQNDYDLAYATLERYKGFFNSGGVTRQQLDERSNAFNEAQANLQAAKAALAVANAEVQRSPRSPALKKSTPPSTASSPSAPSTSALSNPSNSSPSQESSKSTKPTSSASSSTSPRSTPPKSN